MQASTSRPPVSPMAVGAADEHDGDAELLGGLRGAGDDLAGRLVAPHRVDGDREHALTQGDGSSRPRWPGGRRTSRSWGTRRGAAWPGGTAGRRCAAAPTASSCEARRLRLLAFEVFFLGTAIVALSVRIRAGVVRASLAERSEHAPSLQVGPAGRGTDPGSPPRRAAPRAIRAGQRRAPAAPGRAGRR